MNARTAYVLGLLLVGFIFLVCAIIYELFPVGIIGFALILSAILIWSLTKRRYVMRRLRA